MNAHSKKWPREKEAEFKYIFPSLFLKEYCDFISMLCIDST